MIEKLYYWLRDLTSKPGERGERSAGYLQDRIRQVTLELCRPYTGKLLEVGCGEGLFLSQLVGINNNIEAWGIDNWPDILNRARQLLAKNGVKGVNLVEANAQNIPFEDSFFDIIIFINVVICMNTTGMVKAALSQIHRVLKPGGRVVIEFRNKSNPLLRLKYKFAKYYDATAKTHPLSTYYEADIVDFLTMAGFKVLSRKYVGFFVKRLAPVIILEAQKSGIQNHV